MPLLDIGQPGGTRDLAGAAKFSVKVELGADESITVEHQAAQIDGVIEDNLGYSGATHYWRGLLVVSNNAMLHAIVNELNRLRHGRVRDGSGNLSAVNTNYIRETQLTDFDGTAVSQRARLRRWSIGKERQHYAGGRIGVDLEIEFRIL